MKELEELKRFPNMAESYWEFKDLRDIVSTLLTKEGFSLNYTNSATIEGGIKVQSNVYCDESKKAITFKHIGNRTYVIYMHKKYDIESKRGEYFSTIFSGEDFVEEFIKFIAPEKRIRNVLIRMPKGYVKNVPAEYMLEKIGEVRSILMELIDSKDIVKGTKFDYRIVQMSQEDDIDNGSTVFSIVYEVGDKHYMENIDDILADITKYAEDKRNGKQ